MIGMLDVTYYPLGAYGAEPIDVRTFLSRIGIPTIGTNHGYPDKTQPVQRTFDQRGSCGRAGWVRATCQRLTRKDSAAQSEVETFGSGGDPERGECVGPAGAAL